MNGDRLTVSAVLDDAAEIVRRVAAPWGALVFLAALPFRFLQVEFVERIVRLGGQASHYRRALERSAATVVAAFVLLVVARAVYVRACRLSSAVAPSLLGWQPLRVPAAALSSFIAAALLAQTLSTFVIITFIGVPLLTMLSGILAATFEETREPGLFKPFRVVARYTRRPAILFALVLVFGMAFLMLLLNIFFAFRLLLWIAAGAGSFDTTLWLALFSPKSHLFDLLICAGALAMLEPFWLAAHVAYAQKIDARRSGEDLRSWFAAIREEERAEEVAG